MTELEKPKTYAIRTVIVIDKGLKTKAKRPTLIVESNNECEKFPFRFNTKEDLERFPLGKELRIRLEEIPTRLLDEEPKFTLSCPKGVLPNEIGVASICNGCEHHSKQKLCDFKFQEK